MVQIIGMQSVFSLSTENEITEILPVIVCIKELTWQLINLL